MSSSASNQSLQAPASRCLLCNVGCPVRVMRAGPDQWLPDYVPHAGYTGLCGRGSVLVELADHPDRVRDAHRHGGGGREVLDLRAAAAEMAEALRSTDSAAVIVDGNWDVDTLAAVGAFAGTVGAQWAVSLPPSDEALVRGLDSSGCRFVGPEALEQADAMLIVGDVFATHPVAAHWILAAKTRQPRMPVLVLAASAGVTADFASASFQAVPGAGLAAAVAAVRTGNASALGPRARGLAGWKDQLKKAKQPVIVVAADAGRASVLALAAEVAHLAKELQAAVCPLTTYGNAWGALRTAAAGGAASVEDILKDPPQALLVIGADVESALAPQAVASALSSVLTLIYVGPMPNRTSRRAGLVLPAAFAFEQSGRALLGPGREAAFEPLLAPPAGVPTVREILALAGGGAAKADIASPVAAATARANGEPKGEGLLLVLANDPVHFADGSLTREARWPQAVIPRPVLLLAEEDAEAAGLADGRRAVIQGPGGCTEVEVVTDAAQACGQARASAAFPAVRNVFGWKLGGPDAFEPVRVRVGKV
ncbi:MAG: hypothetical protein WBD52_00050 [Phycisphaerae bacterium]